METYNDEENSCANVEDEEDDDEYMEWLRSLGPDVTCPICCRFVFASPSSFEICPICGWENDDLQYDEPNYSGGANDMSLNQYKKAFEEGKPVH